ncbi:MAG TPA: hypothetical protein HPQ04_14115 [Rhodospirillaceae bacterium]|nr:hypothetical protein [Rhodospirillaceae bacterium]
MAVQHLPPPIEIATETKRGVIDGLKKVIEVLQSNGVIGTDVSYQSVIHDPEVLFSFIQAYRANSAMADSIVVAKEGGPVVDDDTPLVCGVSLAQVQQLLVKTCARYFFEQETKGEVGTVTKTVTKTRFFIFKKTEQVESKVGGSFNEAKVRELARFMAFDWQLPLLPAYAQLSAALLMELGEDIINLQTAEAIEDFCQFDQATVRKVKGLVGADFGQVLSVAPAAIGGISTWSKDLYEHYRKVLGEKAWEFFARDKSFFMVCAALDKPLIKIYGDVLCYIHSSNLEELQRLNIDKADVLIGAMRLAFADRLPQILSRPAFSRDILRKLVESLLHLTQEKAQLAVSAQLTCKAIAPQVLEWLAKQPPLEA